MVNKGLTVSVVSHGQASLILQLLQDFKRLSISTNFIITYNIPETRFSEADKNGLMVQEIVNRAPQGFGANHNKAFQLCDTEFFAILNPDLRLQENPFPILIQTAMQQDFGVLAPLVKNLDGMLEDSARRFPTLPRLILKAFGLSMGLHCHSKTDPTPIDWVAGMFMLFKSEKFKEIGGFDERYFLYYEDADICTRLWRQGLPVMIVPQAQVIHEAQRQSHRNLRYLKWHLASMARYLTRYAWRLPRR